LFAPVHAILQVSVCSCYNLHHPGLHPDTHTQTDTQTAFLPAYMNSTDSWAKNHGLILADVWYNWLWV